MDLLDAMCRDQVGWRECSSKSKLAHYSIAPFCVTIGDFCNGVAPVNERELLAMTFGFVRKMFASGGSQVTHCTMNRS